MATTAAHGEPSRSRRLHRWIYRGIVGFVLWMVLAAWGFMSTWSADPGDSYTRRLMPRSVGQHDVDLECAVFLGKRLEMRDFARRALDIDQDRRIGILVLKQGNQLGDCHRDLAAVGDVRRTSFHRAAKKARAGAASARYQVGT